MTSGACTIVHVRDSGVGSTFPAAAIAEYVCGLVQAANDPPSRRHRKETFCSGSVKENAAFGALETGCGPAVIFGARGAALSTTQAYVVWEVFPARSRAATVKVWVP